MIDATTLLHIEDLHIVTIDVSRRSREAVGVLCVDLTSQGSRYQLDKLAAKLNFLVIRCQNLSLLQGLVTSVNFKVTKVFSFTTDKI